MNRIMDHIVSRTRGFSARELSIVAGCLVVLGFCLGNLAALPLATFAGKTIAGVNAYRQELLAKVERINNLDQWEALLNERESSLLRQVSVLEAPASNCSTYALNLALDKAKTEADTIQKANPGRLIATPSASFDRYGPVAVIQVVDLVKGTVREKKLVPVSTEWLEISATGGLQREARLKN